MVDDNISLAKLIINFKSRSNYDAEFLEQMGYSRAKSKAIDTAAKNSQGSANFVTKILLESRKWQTNSALVFSAGQIGFSRRKDHAASCTKRD